MNNLRNKFWINKLNKYSFSTREQIKHNPVLGSLFLFTTFGVGYYVYRQLLFVTTVNNNIKLNRQLTEQLLSNNYVIIDGKLINSHIVNTKKSSTDSKGRILVVGSGPNSIVLTNKLLESGYEVILINQHDLSQQSDLIQEPCRYIFGDIVTFQVRKQNNKFIKKVLQNVSYLFQGDQEIKLNWQILFERNFTIWMVNYFIQQMSQQLITNQNPQEQQKKLEQISKQEMEKFMQTHSQIIKSSQSFYQEEDKLLIKTKFFNNDIINHLKNTYPYSFHHLKKCHTQRFVFDQQGRVIGLLTNQVSQGIVTGDYIILSCEEQSKDLAHFLGSRLPFLNFRDWQLSLGDYNNIIYQINAYEMGGNKQDSEEWALKKLSQQSNLDLLFKKYTLNSLNKPISPDGLPIIGNLPNWPNVIVNVGYNSFGIQDYFGGAKIITDYLSNPKSNKKDWQTFSPERFYLI